MSTNSQQGSPESHEQKLLTAWLQAHNNKQAAAAAALGCSKDQFSRWVRGVHRANPEFLEKIRAAMSNDTPDSIFETTLRDIRQKYPKSPDDIAELAARCGGLNPASKLAGVPAAELYKYARRERDVSPLQQSRIDRALKIARVQPTKRPPSRLPPDRQHRREVEAGEFPPLLQQLIEMHGGVLVRAARALGYATPNPLHKYRVDHDEFDEAAQERVKKALRGEAPSDMPYTRRNTRRDEQHLEPDTGEMGIAIVLAQQRVTEAIYDAGEALGGEWVFRQRISADQWLVICKLEPEKLRPFKMLVRLVADKVVTP